MAQATRKRQVNGQIGNTMKSLTEQIRESISQQYVKDIMSLNIDFDRQFELIQSVYQEFKKNEKAELLKDGIPL